MVQEQLRNVGNVLGVHPLGIVAISVNFKHRNVPFAVNLVSGRALRIMLAAQLYKEGALLHVAVQFLICKKKTEAVLADEQLPFTGSVTPTQSVWPVGYISFGKGLKYQLSIT